MFILIQKNKLKIKRLYDLMNDKNEVNNLIKIKNLKKKFKLF